MPEAWVFIRSTPRDCCSLCGSKEKPFHFEDRPTGLNLTNQRWPYCGMCWTQFEGEKKSAADPRVLLVAWVKFLNQYMINQKEHKWNDRHNVGNN